MSIDLGLPRTAVAEDALAFVRAIESPSTAAHSVRSFLFARALADADGFRSGVDFDEELLFLACVLHDAGTADSAPGRERFEIEGADIAARFLTERGVHDDAVDLVWEAIALHSTPGIAERRAPVVALTRRGVTADFGIATEAITDADAAAVHSAHPRLDLVPTLVDEIVRHAGRSPAAGARFGLPGELAAQRRETGATLLEQAAPLSRWGS